jgi:hypothetical protein
VIAVIGGFTVLFAARIYSETPGVLVFDNLSNANEKGIKGVKLESVNFVSFKDVAKLSVIAEVRTPFSPLICLLFFAILS